MSDDSTSSHAAKRKMTAQQRVLKEWPGAFYNKHTREIQLYTEHITIGSAPATSKAGERDAWADAAKKLCETYLRMHSRPTGAS